MRSYIIVIYSTIEWVFWEILERELDREREKSMMKDMKMKK